jgi:hypothetical protein
MKRVFECIKVGKSYFELFANFPIIFLERAFSNKSQKATNSIPAFIFSVSLSHFMKLKADMDEKGHTKHNRNIIF